MGLGLSGNWVRLVERRSLIDGYTFWGGGGCRTIPERALREWKFEAIFSITAGGDRFTFLVGRAGVGGGLPWWRWLC